MPSVFWFNMSGKRKGKWVKPRHQIFIDIFGPIISFVTLSKYHTKIEHYDYDGQYLILYNHQTPQDQFMVEFSFKKHIYFLATEDIFSEGFISKGLSFLLNPIPIKKSTIDIGSLRTCLQVVKEGGSLAIAPEGNRTYSGKTEYINPSIAALAKKIGLPILLFRIEGGYGAEPRWADKPRKGENRAYVAKEISKEELDAMSKDELYDVIVKTLDVRENAPANYESNKRAEFIERMLYVCPDCGFFEFESEGNEFWCKKCKKKVEYCVDKTLKGVNWDLPFKFAADWYDYQKQFVNKTDVTKLLDTPIFIDQTDLYRVILHDHKELIQTGVTSKLYGDRIEIDKNGEEFITMHFCDISGIAVLGRNKLNIYFGDDVYQYKGNQRLNALKYLNIYTRYKNIVEGRLDDEFLGL